MNGFDIRLGKSPLSDIDEDRIMSIVAALSHARQIGRYRVDGEGPVRRVRLERAQPPAALIELLASRGLPRLQESDLLPAQCFPDGIWFIQTGDHKKSRSTRSRGHLRLVEPSA